ncbi:hypothetical protein FRB94_012311 [Tulasnella sp. JGI-2019a]|nr:hypothetical protein FRB94_012311 [Tulasnella sp. JGI-2019a]KAG9005866.1 hypothetical protein FRB93_009264 [Tulasnella sp. JGI-2019a]KAG9032756.1 hypothetical protein FRB95_001015 [Tulasnella sp. JGI-2019a]
MASVQSPIKTNMFSSKRMQLQAPQDLKSYTIALHEYTANLWLAAREDAERHAKRRSSRDEAKQKRNSSSHR